MMASDRYAYEKFWIAVDALATGRSDLRSRIRNAVIPGLVALQVEDLSSDEDQDDFAAIKEMLRREEGPDGSIAASLAGMSDDECAEVARKIVKVCLSLAKRDDLE